MKINSILFIYCGKSLPLMLCPLENISNYFPLCLLHLLEKLNINDLTPWKNSCFFVIPLKIWSVQLFENLDQPSKRKSPMIFIGITQIIWEKYTWNYSRKNNMYKVPRDLHDNHISRMSMNLRGVKVFQIDGKGVKKVSQTIQ